MVLGPRRTPAGGKATAPPPSLTLFSCRSDVVYQPWKKEDAGNQTREIMYTISLSNPLAPKTSAASEIQVRSRFSGTSAL